MSTSKSAGIGKLFCFTTSNSLCLYDAYFINPNNHSLHVTYQEQNFFWVKCCILYHLEKSLFLSILHQWYTQAHKLSTSGIHRLETYFHYGCAQVVWMDTCINKNAISKMMLAVYHFVICCLNCLHFFFELKFNFMCYMWPEFGKSPIWAQMTQ